MLTAIAAAERLTDNLPMNDRAEPFPAETLPENRAGHLTSDQARRFQRMAAGRRQGARSLAVPVGAIGALLLILNGPAASATTRLLFGWGFLVAAAAILAAPAFDPIAADVRDGRVESVEGAVAKRRVQSGTRTGWTRYYLNIGGRQLQTYLSAYDAAPDAGYVRAYYLPRTRKLVNLERLANPPLPADPGAARDMFVQMARTAFSGDPVAFAEARAKAAGVFDAAREAIAEPSQRTRERVAQSVEREALLGKWTHALATVTFADNGSATVTTILGATKTGHWSVDGHGRLLTDVTGAMEPTDAALEGGRLTIQIEGRRLTFTRAVDV
jgi:hypothetical protein